MRPCRWQSRGSSLVLYVKTPVDVEERQLTLQVGHLRHVCRCMRVLWLSRQASTALLHSPLCWVHAQGDDSTIRNALDTLTCSCMQ